MLIISPTFLHQTLTITISFKPRVLRSALLTGSLIQGSLAVSSEDVEIIIEEQTISHSPDSPTSR